MAIRPFGTWWRALRCDVIERNLGMAVDEFAMIDAHAQAFAASVEQLKDADQQGRAFCETVETV